MIVSQTKKHELYTLLWFIIGITYLTHYLINNILVRIIVLALQIIGCLAIREF